MLKTNDQVRMTKPETESYATLTGESEMPNKIDEFNQMVEQDAQTVEGDDPESKLLSAMIRSFKA